jgi:hypothetical protein
MIRTLFITIILALGIAVSGVHAQDKPSTKSQQNEAADDQQEKQPATQRFVDSDGDGIDDRKGGNDASQTENTKQRRRQRSRDCFIDRDGDGINDSRGTGVGAGRGSGKGKRWGRK